MSIGWGDTVLTIPAGSQHYQTTVSMTYNGFTFNVEVEAGIHSDTGEMYATFQSIDPTTGLPPDVSIGFLPPEDGTGRGQGFLSYTVMPKGNLATGTAITNVANITFDTNAPLATDLVNDDDPSQGIDSSKQALITIDSVAPTSSVAALPSIQYSTSFPVSWSGQDDDNGSGIGSYSIYVSTDGGPFTVWQSATTATSAVYAGATGHTYSFYSVATDGAGNAEAIPAAAQAITQVPAATRFISFDAKHKATFTDAAGNAVTVTLSGPGSGQLGFLDANPADPLVFTLTGTTAHSSLSIRANRGMLRLYDVDVIGSLAAITAPNSILTGALQISGGLGSLTLYGTTDGSVEIGVGVATVFRVGLTDGFAITSASPIRSLTAVDWAFGGAADSLTAPSAGAIKVNASLDAAINLSGALGSLTVGATYFGTLTAGSAASIHIGQNLSGAKINLTGSGLAFRSLFVGGAVEDSDISVTGNIGSVTVGGMTDSDLTAGVSAIAGSLASQTFAENSSILSFVARGTSVFSTSEIAAAVLGSVTLRNVDATAGSQPFGVAAQLLRSFVFAQAGSKTFAWNSRENVSLLTTLPGNLDVDLLT